MKVTRTILNVLVILSVAVAGAWAYFSWDVNRPAGAQEKTEVIIEPGDSVRKIAKDLGDEGVVRSAAVFTLYVQFRGLSTKLQAGRYEIQPDFSIAQIAELLQHGTFDVRLTFLEGWRREQFLEYSLNKLSVDDEEFSREFLAAAKDLEGYLFPDTYVVPVNIAAPVLVDLLNDNFEGKYSASIKPLEEASGLTKKRVVIVASMLERETSNDTAEEMQTIGGILIKRWKSGWLLGVDATVQYTLGYQEDTKEWWKDTLTGSDLKIISPYNTYKYKGLPPGPISNPGLSTLLAVANYDKNTPYWYYLHDKGGQVHYAKDLQEHNRNVSNYLK